MFRLKKTLALLMALVMAFAVMPAALVSASGPQTRDEQYLNSGMYSMPKLTKAEISARLADNPVDMPSDQSEIFTEVPSCSAPYTPGELTSAILERALGRLNALRGIAGVPDVVLNQAFCENAQYGAVLLAASEFSHYPAQPEDMDDDFYALGYEATSSSNIYAGKDFLSTVDGFMDDPGVSNLPMMGHRRWQLNPYMNGVGFGYAYSEDTTYKKYTCEKVFDYGAVTGGFDFIAWPASGFFPNNTESFKGDTAWSISLNTSIYSIPVLSDITVTIVRETDGFEWVLPGTEEYTAATSGRYLTVDTNGYGVVRCCVIFRPDGVDSYFGLYTVRIDGLTNRRGDPVDFAYQVEFFDATPVTSAPDEALNVEGGTLTFTTCSDYPFYYDEVDGRTVAVSGNAGVAPSTSSLTLTLDCNAGDVLSFDYKYRPRNSYDHYVFSANGVYLQDLTSGSNEWNTFTYTAERSGPVTFRWSYTKQYTWGSGLDKLMLDNIELIRQNTGMPGDVNGDGVISFTDVSVLYGYLLGLNSLSPELAANADVDGDGSVTFNDVGALYYFCLGN